MCGTPTSSRVELEAALAARPAAGWVEALTTVGVACAPVQRLSEVLESEQVQVLRMVASQRHPSAGEVPTVRLPVTMSDSESTAATSTPLLGDANETGWGICG